MGQKEFKKKFMHVTRRKLVDMVHTGKYDKNTTVGWTPNVVERNVGDIWEDESTRYEKKEDYILRTPKNSEALQAVRDYLHKKTICKNKDCKTIKKTRIDKKLIEKSGYCINCLAVIETQIKIAGIWTEYQNYKIWTNMIIEGKIRLEQLRQTHAELKQVYEYINEDGTREPWTLPQPVEEVKKEMMELIINGEKELEEIEERRVLAFKVIKKENYEQYL